MATRLDRVTTRNERARRAASPRTREREASWERAAPPAEGLGEVTTGEKELPVRALGGAMASWFALTFGLCYVVLPALLAITGINPRLINTFWFDLPAFAIVSFVATVGVLVERPRIDLSPSARSPVLAAMAGGLGVWAVIHNASQFLVPFAEMSTLQFTSLLGINLVEMGMLGAMFASFTKRSDVALALGGGFQLALFALLLSFFSFVV